MAAAELQNTFSPVDLQQQESGLWAFTHNRLVRVGAAAAAALLVLTGCSKADDTEGSGESQIDVGGTTAATASPTPLVPGATTAPPSAPAGTYPRGGWERTGPGENGPSEKADQLLLIYVGCLPEGSADGYVSEDPNSQTVRAIKAAQTALGVTVDGWIYTETRTELVEAAAAGEKVCAAPIQEIADDTTVAGPASDQDPAAGAHADPDNFGCAGTTESLLFGGGEQVSDPVLCPDTN